MLIATVDHLYWMDPDGREPREIGPAGAVLALAADCGVQAAVVGDELIALVAGCDEPCRFPLDVEEKVTSLAIISADPLGMLIGTEPPAMYRWSRRFGCMGLSAFDRLECRDTWRTPWGGPPAVRSLATTLDGWVYADIHVGSIMRSDDLGFAWQPVTPTVHVDVHQVATSPADLDRVVANTAAGVYVSDDRGRSWQHRAEDLNNRYGRAVAICPTDADVMLASVSDGPHGDDVHGQLYRTEDAGRSWTHVTDGFPASMETNIDTFAVSFASASQVWALGGRTLYCSENQGASWAAVWSGPQALRMIASQGHREAATVTPGRSGGEMFH